MRWCKCSAVVAFCILALSCKRPDPIRLEPTFEEPATLVSMIRISDPTSSSQLVRGFFPLEATWRWAGPRFMVVLAPPFGARQNGAALLLRFHLPDIAIEKLKTVTMTAKVGDVSLAPETYSMAGDHEYRRAVPSTAFIRDPIDVEFTLDKALKIDGDPRKLGVVVTQVGLESK